MSKADADLVVLALTPGTSQQPMAGDSSHLSVSDSDDEFADASHPGVDEGDLAADLPPKLADDVADTALGEEPDTRFRNPPMSPTACYLCVVLPTMKLSTSSPVEVRSRERYRFCKARAH